jgi:hypothetical protein
VSAKIDGTGSEEHQPVAKSPNYEPRDVDLLVV